MKTLTTVRNGLRYVRETQATKSTIQEDQLSEVDEEKEGEAEVEAEME